MAKAVFLGLDGLSARNLEDITRAGRLRVIARLLGRGVEGSALMVHPLTPPMWTSMTTGVNPGKHGIYYFQRVDERGIPQGLHNALDVGYPRIHHVLSYNRMRSLVANLPLSTWPLIPFRGTLLPDWLSPRWAAWPSEYTGEFNRLYDTVSARYRGRHEFPCKYVTHDIATAEFLLRNYERIDVAGHDFVFIMFRFIDALMHKDPDAITDTSIPCMSDLYNALEDLYERVLDEHLDEALIVVAGDHGTDRVDYEVSLASMLYREGLVEARQAEISDSRFIRDKKRSRLSRILAPIANALMSNRVTGPLATRLGRQLVRLFPAMREAAIGVRRPVPDPDKSLVIMNETVTFSLYVNTRLVPREEVGKVLERVEQVLRKYEEETGHRFIHTIARGRGHLFHGPYERYAPHLLVAPRIGYSFGSLNVLAPPVEGVGGRYGNHHPDNLHIIVPPAGDEQARLLAGRVRMPWDYAVLILLHLGVPLPAGHDSRLPEGLAGVRVRDYRRMYMISRRMVEKRMSQSPG